MSTTDKAQQNQAVAVQQKNITEQVLAKIETFKSAGELRLPTDYSPENALKAAYLVLLETKTRDGKSVMEACTKESIANSLLKMVVWGLSPLKKQCDFIAYGDKLSCDPEYTGNIALAIRYGGLKHHKANAIFKGDDFKFEVGVDGRRKLVHHKQELESIGGDVMGAYVTYELEDGTQDMEIMNITQIRNSWMQGGSKGASNAHKNFSDQMAIKTVYNRMCKLLIRASNDAPLMTEGTSDDEKPTITASSSAKQEVLEKANAEEISFEDVPTETTQEVAGSMTQEARPVQENAQAEIPY